MLRKRIVLENRLSVLVCGSRFYQNKNNIQDSHGAGLVQHGHMSEYVPFNNFSSNMSKASAAADLHRTPVHQGLGTSAVDPYERTLPNVPTAPPASTVTHSHEVAAFSATEVEQIHKRWGSLGFWINEQYPRLSLYLQEQLVTDSAPVSSSAEQTIKEFLSKGIPELLKADSGKVEQVQSLWKKAIEEYNGVSKRYLFDRASFERELSAVHTATKKKVRDVADVREISLALDLLSRYVVSQRNRILQVNIIPYVSNSAYLSGGDAVWRIFFNAVNRYKAEIFRSGDESIAYAWEALLLEDVTRLPQMTAPVALFLTLLSVQLSNELVSATHAKESSTLDEGLTYDNQSLDMYIDMVSSTVRRSFVREAVVGLLSTVQGASLLSKALLSHQFYDLGREAALCESMNDVRALLVAEAESLCYAFETPAEVKKLLSKITAVKDSEPAKHVQATFGITANQTNWDDIFQKADWTSNWRSLTIALFSNEAVLDRASVLIANEIGSKMAAGRLFSQDFLDKLKEISSARKNRKVSREEKIRLIASELSSFEHVSKSLSLLRSIGVDMSKIDDAARSVREEKATARAAVDSDLMRSVLDSIRARHPNWVKAGVLRPEVDFNSTPSMVQEMVRMFVRLSYMPHTGAAAIAQHTRRRIGNIGTESYQYNVPAEFGFVEQYDNLQYKRYDWQGWYQRMVDIHNRNVSIRCRIDDLKRLDSDGNPFVDLQTERRLRILSDHRVGMGVLKLDSDKYEDQEDNITSGVHKLSELLADSRKAQLGQEYWPTVEVKVRNPSGQSKTYYSVIDDDRVEKKSKEYYDKYKEAKKRSLFVTPIDTWLEVKGMQTRKTSEAADARGYTVDMIDAMNTE